VISARKSLTDPKKKIKPSLFWKKSGCEKQGKIAFHKKNPPPKGGSARQGTWGKLLVLASCLEKTSSALGKKKYVNETRERRTKAGIASIYKKRGERVRIVRDSKRRKV